MRCTIKYWVRISRLPMVMIALATSRQPANGQTASLTGQLSNGRQTDTNVGVRRLEEVLNELKLRYQADILFEDKTVAGLTVPTDILAGSTTLPASLDRLSKLLGLRYKQVKPGTWVILANKERKSAWVGGGDAPGESTASGSTTIPPTGDQAEARTSVKTPVTQPERIPDISVRGKVTDNETNEGLPGVSVVVKGTTQGTTTDAGGNYQLVVPGPDNALVFSYIGYTNQEAVVGSRSTVDIRLLPTTKSLSEVVVVGYGTVKRSDLTGSVTSVPVADVKKLVLTSPDQAIQGQAAGVFVTQNSSAPGAGTTVRIRGGNSIQGGNEPLYVIDGIPIYNDLGTSNGAATNPLSAINTNDIVKHRDPQRCLGNRHLRLPRSQRCCHYYHQTGQGRAVENRGGYLLRRAGCPAEIPAAQRHGVRHLGQRSQRQRRAESDLFRRADRGFRRGYRLAGRSVSAGSHPKLPAHLFGRR